MVVIREGAAPGTHQQSDAQDFRQNGVVLAARGWPDAVAGIVAGSRSEEIGRRPCRVSLRLAHLVSRKLSLRGAIAATLDSPQAHSLQNRGREQMNVNPTDAPRSGSDHERTRQHRGAKR